MTKRDVIYRLRNVKDRLAASGVVGRQVIPFAEAGDQAVDDPRRAAYERTYLRALGMARKRLGPEFVPEAPADPRARPAQVRVLAFYLPQFHPIPENDEWWGKGFTEWTNVSMARPLFAEHYQPHLPADLGFYDLRLREVMREQAQLARANGIDAFCYHYYWFSGKRLL